MGKAGGWADVKTIAELWFESVEPFRFQMKKVCDTSYRDSVNFNL